MLGRVPRWVALALVLSGGLLLALAPAAAQGPGTATVSIDASVVIPTELSITLCDQTADFGNDLDFLGTPPISGSTDDAIFATSAGDRDLDQGVFYGWTPRCEPGASFMHVESSVQWNATVCAEESGGSSSLKIANDDLRISLVKASSYEQARGLPQVKVCTNPTLLVQNERAGTMDLAYYLYLQVDRSDTPGTFSTTAIWSVMP